jgi:hypothetical protein
MNESLFHHLLLSCRYAVFRKFKVRLCERPKKKKLDEEFSFSLFGEIFFHSVDRFVVLKE